MGLRIVLLLIISSLVACGGASHDEGNESDTKVNLIPPEKVEGNFQNLPPEMQSNGDLMPQPGPPAGTPEKSETRNPAPPVQASLPQILDDEEDKRLEYKPGIQAKAPATEDNAPAVQPAPDEKPSVQPPPAPPKVERPIKPDAEKLSELEKELLHLINQSRAKKGIAPLRFSRMQSNGTHSCPGSQGHSERMSRQRGLFHNLKQNICLRTMAASENVGYATGDAIRAIRTVHKMMMDEGPGGGETNHYDNIMNPTYNTVGLGFYYSKDRTLWITENFLRL